MIDVGQHLVIRVRMDGGHDAAEQTDFFMQGFDQRSKAIGRARGIRNHRIRCGKFLIIDSKDDGHIDGLSGRHQAAREADVARRVDRGRALDPAVLEVEDDELAGLTIAIASNSRSN